MRGGSTYTGTLPLCLDKVLPDYLDQWRENQGQRSPVYGGSTMHWNRKKCPEYRGLWTSGCAHNFRGVRRTVLARAAAVASLIALFNRPLTSTTAG